MISTAVYKIFRLVAGIALFAWLILWVDWRQLIAALQRCNPWVATIGVTLFAVATIPAAFRVKALFPRLDLPFGWALRLTLSSYFFNQLLPTGLGGDAYRSLRLKNDSGGWISAIGLLAFERAVSALTLIVPALVYSIVQHGDTRVAQELRGHLGASPVVAFFLIGTGIAVAAGALVMVRRAHHRLRRLQQELVSILRHLSFASVSAVLVLSLLFHALRVLGSVAFLEAVGYSIALGDLVIVMALTLLASLVPVSIGALGVREGILVHSLGAYGVPHAAALTVALLGRLVVVLLGLAGGLVFNADRVDPRGSVDETETGS